ncbi:hypothetical protein WQQ_38710 [Hydrocarboniphaga effusa AP103]|jgi:DNA-binding GntR family transcriptional regulator|uniref:HTH gntR-type domain-containing protein n=2 Tax=Nevskiaceae TaxID=568386 RepID=I8HYV1_9GAMM|nr:hypothetical protein WQQ_38710 [Hydrocarboniphaga effusa AP103]
MRAPATGQTLDRACMRTRIRELLVSRILDGAYPAGFHLKELALAREFKVSQAPVREALRELETLGLVIAEPYRGTRVRSTDVAEMLDAYELRATIEVRSVELAMPFADSVCEALAADMERIRLGFGSPEKDTAYLPAVLAFHRRLVEASGNRAFLTTWDSFHWDVRARLLLRRIAESGNDYSAAVGFHQAILDRVRAADTAGAMAAIRVAFASFLSAFRQALDPHGP